MINFIEYDWGKVCPSCNHVQALNSSDGKKKLVCPDCLEAMVENFITCCQCRNTSRAV
jgi:predicted RNA-binding Zn-ribbon protein involved in translation (DUF1610 family)